VSDEASVKIADAQETEAIESVAKETPSAASLESVEEASREQPETARESAEIVADVPATETASPSPPVEDSRVETPEAEEDLDDLYQ